MSISLIIALDNIRSHHNVGACFRSADAFAVNEIILGGISPCPPHRDIQKSALGATESVAWSHSENLSERLKRLQSEGYTVIAIEQVPEAVSMRDFKPENLAKKLVLVMGNEVKGVSKETLSLANACWEIPQSGIKKSLNVSVCAGICMYHVRQVLEQ